MFGNKSRFHAVIGMTMGLAIPVFAQEAKIPPPSGKLVYESPFQGYRPYTEAPTGDWRKINDEMGRLNGNHDALPGDSGTDGKQPSMRLPSAPAETKGSSPIPHSGHEAMRRGQ